VALVEGAEGEAFALPHQGDQVLVGQERVASWMVSHAARLESLIRRVEGHRCIS
jgi:hypothetical protein